jgi:hypothetical protein
MLQLKNNSPFNASIAIFPNERGVDSLYLAVKGTFVLGASVTIAEQQVPVRMADEFWGEPGQSSLKYAAEVHLTKPATDIVVLGAAHSPDGTPVTSVDVTVQVGNTRKVIRVFGERKWYLFEKELRITPPGRFVTMPLVYERAYGGIHEGIEKSTFEQRNPVGRSFLGERRPEDMHGQSLPNLEDPAQLITAPADTPQPACFGYLAASWQPRKEYAGTYDKQWQQKKAPYLPTDFQSRYFNAAHPDLVYRGFARGGEPVTITNMTSDGMLKFTLPLCEFDVAVQVEERTETPVMNLETILIEPEEHRLSLLWRGVVECDKRALKVHQIDVALRGATP